MISCAAPLAMSDCEDVTDVCNRQRAPRKAFITPFIPQVISEISRYRSDLAGGRSNPMPFGQDSHDAYFDLYDSKAGAVVEILAGVWKLYESITLCPYCLIDTVEHLDHYFPRSVFPQYSISSQNLIPSCGICNTDYKKTLWANSPGREFLHPYFDSVPGFQFLYCVTSVGRYRAFNVSFDIPVPASAPPEVALLKRHFDKLELNKRYVAKVAAEEVPKMGRIIDAYNDRDTKIHELESFVRLQVLGNAVNTWEHAFYQSIRTQVAYICDQ